MFRTGSVFVEIVTQKAELNTHPKQCSEEIYRNRLVAEGRAAAPGSERFCVLLEASYCDRTSPLTTIRETIGAITNCFRGLSLTFRFVFPEEVTRLLRIVLGQKIVQHHKSIQSFSRSLQLHF
jgi:hypothetical protein